MSVMLPTRARGAALLRSMSAGVYPLAAAQALCEARCCSTAGHQASGAHRASLGLRPATTDV